MTLLAALRSMLRPTTRPAGIGVRPTHPVAGATTAELDRLLALLSSKDVLVEHLILRLAEDDLQTDPALKLSAGSRRNLAELLEQTNASRPGIIARYDKARRNA